MFENVFTISLSNQVFTTLKILLQISRGFCVKKKFTSVFLSSTGPYLRLVHDTFRSLQSLRYQINQIQKKKKLRQTHLIMMSANILFSSTYTITILRYFDKISCIEEAGFVPSSILIENRLNLAAFPIPSHVMPYLEKSGSRKQPIFYIHRRYPKRINLQTP